MTRTAPTHSERTNHAAATFRELAGAWHYDAASDRVGTLAAKLAADVAANGTTCVALIRSDAAPQYYGLVFLLDTLGILLRKRRRANGDAIFVYAEPKNQNHVATTVADRTAERTPEQAERPPVRLLPELPRAA